MIRRLQNYIEKLKKVTIAYSGGVDSTFLLAVSARVLGKREVLALTIRSPLTPPWEVEFAIEFCRVRRIKHLILDGSFILNDELFTSNPPQRCYHCKKKLLEAVRENISDDYAILTGTNASDELDFRPGMRAEQEMGVRTPLRELGFTKDIIREYSRAYEIPGFERLPSPCFATRIPYGESITSGKVEMIENAETFMRNLGFELIRVRLTSKDSACIEVAKEEIKKLFDLRERILRQLGDMGFQRVTVDLEGYKQDRLNY